MRTIARASVACLAAFGLHLSTAYAGDFVPSGNRGVLKSSFIGCGKLDDLTKVARLMDEDDREALSKFVMRSTNTCRVVEARTTGVVESNSAWSSATCLRPKGEPDCIWLPMGLVVAP